MPRANKVVKVLVRDAVGHVVTLPQHPELLGIARDQSVEAGVLGVGKPGQHRDLGDMPEPDDSVTNGWVGGAHKLLGALGASRLASIASNLRTARQPRNPPPLRPRR